jgi:hypothetical protein
MPDSGCNFRYICERRRGDACPNLGTRPDVVGDDD